MFFPFRTDTPLHSVPWMNFALIFANFVAFLFQLAHPHALDPYMLSPRTPQLLHYLTYAFLHQGWSHILGNMLFLYIFGNNVNDKLGQFGYLAFYLAGAVFAGIGFVLTQTSAPVLGASGAVAAVTGAYLVLFPRSNVTIIYWLVFFIGQFEVTSMVMIVFFFLKDLFLGLVGVAGGPAATEGVAHSAHIGGSLFGFAVALCLLAVGLLPRSPYDLLALVGRWNKRRQYQALVRQGYNPFAVPVPATGPAAPPDPTQIRIMELRAQISDAISRQNLPGAAALYLRLKSFDPAQVLSRQAQLEVANQLAHEQKYAAAVDAYQLFLQTYASHDSAGHVELMLGLILSRYLHRPQDAKPHLEQALARVHTQRDRDLAQSELDHIRQSPTS